MAENYKVNFKSSLNDFKRKHNKLVDNGIVEIVNNGIESGDIQAGGTKLYVHTFYIDTTGLSNRTITIGDNNGVATFNFSDSVSGTGSTLHVITKKSENYLQLKDVIEDNSKISIITANEGGAYSNDYEIIQIRGAGYFRIQEIMTLSSSGLVINEKHWALSKTINDDVSPL